MLLFFDVESSGLIRDDLPAESESQPHVVQLGAHLLDFEYRPMAILETLVKPESWTVEPEAFAVHKISEADCVRYGLDIRAVLATFQQMCMKARVIVAHHANFDRKMIAAQLAKIGSDGHWWTRQSGKIYCSMEHAVEHCRIPGEFGLKFPSLAEAFCHFNPGVAFETTHRAGPDIGATISVYRAIQERERINV